MEEFKKTLSFLDRDQKRVRLEIELTKRNGYPELAITGGMQGHGGQIRDHINPAGSNQKYLLDIWKTYHLEEVTPDIVENIKATIRVIKKEEEEKEKARREEEPDDIAREMEEEGIPEEYREAVEIYKKIMGSPAPDLSTFMEDYAGEWASHAEFAQNMAESIGALDGAPDSWPFTCIDWKKAGGELLHDYHERDGHYFRAG